jgi:hypothetical protein
MTTTQQESITAQLMRRGLIKPPKFLTEAVHYETEVGSVAYDVCQQSSDLDVYGFCIPDVPAFGGRGVWLWQTTSAL